MRIAVVHDFMDNIGGGEKLAAILAQELDADLITTNLDMHVLDKMGFVPRKILNLGELPKLPPFKQMAAARKFSRYDYSTYDAVIFSGNWAVFGARRAKKSIWYCHTPCREFFDQKAKIMVSLSLLQRPLFWMWSLWQKRRYMKAIAHSGRIICNSAFTRAKIRRYLKKKATVIYPPVGAEGFKRGEGRFWLAVSRIYPAKNIDMLFDVFSLMPDERLLLVGSAGRGDHSRKYWRRLRKRLPNNVTMVQRVSYERLGTFMSHAKGFISLSEEEDFGMNVAEALEAGIPVVCSDEGGHKELVEHGKNGYLVPLRPLKIIEAMRSIKKIKDPRNLQDLSIRRFVTEMREEVGGL